MEPTSFSTPSTLAGLYVAIRTASAMGKPMFTALRRMPKRWLAEPAMVPSARRARLPSRKTCWPPR